MSLFHEILTQAATLSCFAGGVAFFRARRLMHGRHVSRPVCRRVGVVGAWATRASLFAFWLGMTFAVVLSAKHRLSVPYDVVTLAVNAWTVDDWLFDGDDPKRKHEWARVRLRMPKPVKIRQVERWKPMPA